jgi:hypothetical protein
MRQADYRRRLLAVLAIFTLCAACDGPPSGPDSIPRTFEGSRALPASTGNESTSTTRSAAGTELGDVALQRAVGSGGNRLSGVGFAPQVPPGDWSKTMSCGPAALNMGAAYLWGVQPNQAVYIPKICQFLGRTDVNNCLPGGTSTSDLVKAAKAINNAPNTYAASGWTIARLQREIDNGRPVVVAVRAGALPNRGYKYTGGHFVLVVGYDAANVIAHDPGTSGGAFKSYKNADFAGAMRPYNGAVVVPMR